jgi:acetone carboxylase gamma subunit
MTVGVMAHEAVHIADFIFTNCGITHDLDNDEPFAYLVEWIINELYEFYKECFYGL